MFGKWLIDRVKLYGASKLLQYIASGISATGSIAGPALVGAYWDNQKAALNTYSNQQLHDLCVQDYQNTEPDLCV